MSLWQGETWVDAAGDKIQISTMEPRYALNCVRWLERRAAALMNNEALRFIGGPQPSGDMATDAFDRMVAELLEYPLESLRETPLYGVLLTRAVGEEPFYISD